MGHLLHALVSFGSEDPNESLPQRVNSQFAWTVDTSGDWQVITYCLFAAAVLIGC